MRTLIRPIVIGLCSAWATTNSLAQNPFFVRATMHVENCYLNQLGELQQEIYWGGTGNPSFSTSDWVVQPSACGMALMTGGHPPNTRIILTCTTQCGGAVLTLTDTIQFTSTPDTIEVQFDFDCTNGNTVDCLGVTGGGAVSGTPCVIPGGIYGTWDPDCICNPVPLSCEACFTFNSPGPFMVDFSNCSDPPTGENDALWELPDGSIYTPPPPYLVNSPSYTFDSPGVYTTCFTILDYGPIEGCTFCDTLYVDELGNVSDTPQGDLDCLGVPGGAAVVGSPCDDGDPLTIGDMYLPNCTCMGVAEGDCYTWADLEQLIVDGVPVPFETVLEASTAGAQPITYSWHFGLPYVLEGTSTVPSWPHTFSAGGSLAFMVTAVDANGCESAWTNVEGLMSCDGILGSSAWPGLPCTDPLTGETGIWSSNCECIVNAPACAACFETEQAIDGPSGLPIPFTAYFDGTCIQGVSGFQAWFDYGDGTGAWALPTHTFASAGTYNVCLTITDAIGCTSTFCDSLFVDANGTVSLSGSSNTDCLGVAGGSAVPGTPCTDPITGQTGLWSGGCICATGTGCEACIELTPATYLLTGELIPWTVEATSCITGGLSYDAWFDWGDDSLDSTYHQHTFAEPGLHTVCIIMWDSQACIDTACVSFYINGDGTVLTDPPFPDCLGQPGGSALPGTPCAIPGTVLEGTWSADCDCVPDSPNPCNAGFFTMQAYQWVDSAANPNGGGGEVVPNEVWVWNLSSGGTGLFQFTWDFGDGSTSNEAFPTHTYAGSGTYELCLTVLDNVGCTDVYCDSITIDNDGILGGLMGEGNRTTWILRVMNPLLTAIGEEVALTDLSLWPNPANDELNLRINGHASNKLRISIADVSGRVLSTRTDVVSNGLNDLVIPLADLQAGSYLLILDNGSKPITERFVKVN